VGYASHPEVLERAGARGADMLIAVTSSDEVNMVACQVAYSLFGVCVHRIQMSPLLPFRNVTLGWPGSGGRRERSLYEAQRDVRSMVPIMAPALRVALRQVAGCCSLHRRTESAAGHFLVRRYAWGNGCGSRGSRAGVQLPAELPSLASFRLRLLLLPGAAGGG
jgi:hypothetical protein